MDSGPRPVHAFLVYSGDFTRSSAPQLTLANRDFDWTASHPHRMVIDLTQLAEDVAEIIRIQREYAGRILGNEPAEIGLDDLKTMASSATAAAQHMRPFADVEREWITGFHRQTGVATTGEAGDFVNTVNALGLEKSESGGNEGVGGYYWECARCNLQADDTSKAELDRLTPGQHIWRHIA